MGVLVTGGAGFVGSYVVRDLLAKDERVVVYDRSLSGNALDLLLPNVAEIPELTLAEGPITDGWRILRLCQHHEIEQIVHLASPLTQDVAANPITGIRDICEGTATVFEVARATRVKKVVWASSVAVFGAKHHYQPGPIPNDAPHRPENLYGSCKSLCERMAIDYRDRHGVESVGLRLSVVYGCGRQRGYMSFPSELIRRAARSEHVDVPISDQRINWQYVEEVSGMVVAALEAEATTDLAFNTCGDARSFRDAGEILARLAAEATITLSDAATDDGQLTLREVPFEYDAAELAAQVGYSAQFPLERGIEESFAAFRRLADVELTSTR
jgi:nucleoside-diphosphate-sugar epimerase